MDKDTQEGSIAVTDQLNQVRVDAANVVLMEVLKKNLMVRRIQLT